MEWDLERWRRLGHDTVLLDSDVVGAQLIPRNRSYHNTKPKIQPIHHAHHHPTSDKLKLPIKGSGPGTIRDRIFLNDLMDKLSQDQKKDIKVIWTGHLNHDNINKGLPSTTAVTGLGTSGGSGRGGEKTHGKAMDETQGVNITATIPHPDYDISHVDAPPNMHHLLEKYDTVKIRQKQLQESSSSSASISQQQPTSSTAKKEQLAETFAKTNEIRKRFVPNYKFSLTENERYHTLKNVDDGLVESDWIRKKSQQLKVERLDSLYALLNKELKAAGCPDQGPDMRRLQIYKTIFDMIISEFKVYGPILAEIKKEYDTIIEQQDTNNEELIFLRGKVRKLLAQNENRLLLKYERKKCLELEKRMQKLSDENDSLKAELRRKLAIYAGYLPASVLHDRKREDPLLVEVESSITKFVPGEDPLTMYERQISELSNENASNKDEIEKLKKAQEEEFVPRTIKEKIEHDLVFMVTKYNLLKSQSDQLQEELKTKQSIVEKLEHQLRDKEEQYHFLIAEYTTLTESVAQAQGKKGGAGGSDGAGGDGK
ncbi:Clathrin heavy chain linker domain-containing protein 1 [Blyttiomyces sp. JEL0837]|nr:Clathrin heavy chain linker domain-containing protein 1 [Blyttiomyces sp. JEL0837]